MIVALGNDNTIDISTGASVDMLVASADSQYISPLSSAYAYAETDEERSALLDSLGLTTLNYDPIAVLAAGGIRAQRPTLLRPPWWCPVRHCSRLLRTPHHL